jgi:hypothetical protein
MRLCDTGKGLPQGHDATVGLGSRTGMRLIDAFSRQIGAKPVWSSPQPTGTALCLEFDRRR